MEGCSRIKTLSKNPYWERILRIYKVQEFQVNVFFTLDIKGKKFILSDPGDTMGNIKVNEEWMYSEQVPPYTTCQLEVHNGIVRSVLFESSFFTKDFRTEVYNEAFLFSERFNRYYSKHNNELVIDRLLSTGVETCLVTDNNKVIMPRYKIEFKDGTERLMTNDEYYALPDWSSVKAYNGTPIYIVQ